MMKYGFKDHVRTSQYCLQIVKCDNSECRLPWRGSFRTIIPLPVAQTINGIKPPERNNQSNSHYLGLFRRLSMDGQLNSLLPQSARVFHIVPYDLYCPSVQEDLQGRICQACGLYFASNIWRNGPYIGGHLAFFFSN